MRYDFDTIIDRSRTDSVKWNVKDGELPMWVADMDFMAAPEMLEAIEKRMAHGVFGYANIGNEWYNAYTGWWKSRHGFEMDQDWLMFCTGVIPAISSMIRKLTEPGDYVVVQTPVYNVFFNCIVNNGCRILENPLSYKDRAYFMDFEDLERKLAEPQTKLMLLCNPQNPAGRIWDRDSLERIGKLAVKHHVYVISDEIHCDITEPGKGYIPFASVSPDCRDISITCISPTKTFNIAGLHTAAVCVPEPSLRRRVRNALNTGEVSEPNSFAITAAVAAFNKGGDWLDELREYIAENKRIAADYIAARIPGVFIVEGDATYLLWIDVGCLGSDSKEIAGFIRETTGLFVSAGGYYGKAGNHFLRMNIACPKEVCLDGLSRLKTGIALYREHIGSGFS